MKKNIEIGEFNYADNCNAGKGIRDHTQIQY